MNKISFGIIGCGYIGKRHAETVASHPDCEVVALCDILPKTTSQLATSPLPYYNKVSEMLEAHPELEVVCICTPNGIHAEQAIEVLQSGKHVVIEKPMGLSRANCEEVIHTALTAGKQVFCVMQNRYSPPAQWIRQVLDDKILGKILLVQINCYWNRDDRYYFPDGVKHAWHGDETLDGGILYTQFSHFIDMMYWLFGDISNIKSQSANYKHQHSTPFPDTGMVQFEFNEGGMGCFNYSTAVWDKNFESSLTILGEKGTVKIGGQYMDQVEYCHIENYKMPELSPSNPANDYGTYKGSANNHHQVIQNVVDVLRGKKSITTNALEGMKVVEMIERMEAEFIQLPKI